MLSFSRTSSIPSVINRPHIIWSAALILLLSWIAPTSATDTAVDVLADLHLPAGETAPHYRMPGEFESQQALLLSCGGMTATHADKIAEIALAVRSRIRVVVLCVSQKQQESVAAALRRRAASLQNIEFLLLPHDTRWVRDYGPTVLCALQPQRKANRQRSQMDRLTMLIDWQYDETRPNDDLVPLHLAGRNKLPLRRAAQVVEGGNLLSNGQGLVVVSRSVLERNSGLAPEEIQRAICLQTGASQVVILEPLIGEATGHVDMFASFTNASTVVVGQYSLADDPANSGILDHNAAVLSSLTAAGRPLRVVRIPMGRNDDGHFRSYTNCVFANGIFLMPTYDDDMPSHQQQSLAEYQRLLPTWRIVTIESSDLIAEGGALHCISLNLPSFSPRSRLVRP